MKFVAIALFYQCFFFGSTMLYKITQMLLKLYIYTYIQIDGKLSKNMIYLKNGHEKKLKCLALFPGSWIRVGFGSPHISSVSLQAYAFRHIFMLPLRLD